jgi:transposase-like protein
MKNPRNTDAFKEQAIVKSLNRGNRSLKEISAELNLGLSTLTRWMRNAALAAPSSPLQGA